MSAKGQPRNLPPESRCNAAPRPGGPRKEPCKNPKVTGQKRCAMHGGKNKTTGPRKDAIIQERKARRALGKMKITPVEDPLTTLKELAGEVLAWKQLMQEKVKELEHLRYRGEHAEQIRAEVTLYERAIDRAVSTLSVIAKLNIDERLAAITERQAEMLEQGLMAAFEEAGIPITDQEVRLRVAKSFGRHLQLVS